MVCLGKSIIDSFISAIYFARIQLTLTLFLQTTVKTDSIGRCLIRLTIGVENALPHPHALFG